MHLHRFRTQSTLCIALLALCLQLLLPFVHAMPLRVAGNGLVSQSVCSVSKSAALIDRHAPDVSSAIPCTMCLASTSHAVALPPVFTVLPAVFEYLSVSLLVRDASISLPIQIYTLPQSHAPPQYLA